MFKRDEECTCCGKPIKPGREVWLELDQRTNTYHDLGGVPADKSQGWFLFGSACAKRKRREHKENELRARQAAKDAGEDYEPKGRPA